MLGASVALSTLSGCAFGSLQARPGSLESVEDPQLAFAIAMRAFYARDWDEAKAMLGEVRKLYPNSRYARSAELRLADVELAQDKYGEASNLFREFIQNHKNDPDVEYAGYKLAKALFLDIDDTILLPPLEERDQATSTEAYRDIRKYLRDFPSSPYAEEVRYMLEVVTGRLFRHHLYVARYYLRSDNFGAAVARIDFAVKTYKESALVPEALVLKGETLIKMKKNAEAREAFLAVIGQHGGPFVEAARRFIERLDELEGKGAPQPEKRPTPS